MDQPTSLSFTDLEVNVESLFQSIHGPMDPQWTRVSFHIPNGWQAPQEVKRWMVSHTPGHWRSYHYPNPRGAERDFIMVVRFQDRGDALMFKLRDGHRAWEG